MKKNNGFVKNLIIRMTLEQKIGSLLTLGFAGTVPGLNIYEYINKYHCGGLRLSCESRTFGNYVDPKSSKTAVSVESDVGIKYPGVPPTPTASQYKGVLDHLQQVARARPLSLPLHFSFDQEGGSSSDFSFGNVNLFPKPMGLRATDDPQLAYEVARAVSRQSRAVGFHWIHSPVLDINTDVRNPEINTRAYSDCADEVLEYARESCRGFQDGGLIATGKHFPGRGHSDVDAHFHVPVIDVDKKTMLERELAPYRALIAQGLLPSIMLAHSVFPAFDLENIATVSRKIITGLLREELGFDGVITTDSMTMGALSTRYGVPNACAMSLEAGADLVLMKAENSLVEETFNAIKAAVEQGRIPIEELDKKVYRVLSLKYEYGLFYPQEESRIPEEVIGNPAIQSLASLVAKRSVLVARNEDQLLPLRKDAKVLVVEQKVKQYNSFQWHSGILYENCARLGGDVSYLETAYSYDELDKERILAASCYAEIIVITNYFLRGNLCNQKFIQDFIAGTDKPVIVVANTPYEEINIPPNARNVLVTFATSPENVKVVAETLFGTIRPEGVWPLSRPLSQARQKGAL